MNLPFYETGRIKRIQHQKRYFNNSITDKKIKPHQIYAAGDLEDPHGTPKYVLILFLMH
ncbi:MAG: hypothetical protein CM15mP102_10140 [Flavobacteriales bacterium]|nr:MAG: hypothetical protein CM15mP102_10140 [Flavobacteriales bacterium]